MNSPNFHNIYAQLPPYFFSKSRPTPVKSPKLISANKNLALEIGLDPEWLESENGLAMLSGNKLPQGSDPIAQVYAGHQFGGWVPRLGDGRAHLIGQLRSNNNHYWDVSGGMANYYISYARPMAGTFIIYSRWYLVFNMVRSY